MKKKQSQKQKFNERRTIVKRILDGENIVEVAKSLGRTPSSLQERLQRFCRRSNPDLYEKGRNKMGSSNNYITPPLQYLRNNKATFLKELSF